MDRVSSLPEPLLHQVMSFLPVKEVVRNIVLSKRWKQAWDSCPFLEFDRVQLTRDPEMILRYLERTLRGRLMEMVSTQTFTLHLAVSNDYEFSSLLDNCISYAIASNVKSLKFTLRSGLYTLPQMIFSAKSVCVLELVWCKLEPPRSKVELYCLMKLRLFRVVVDDQSLQSLVAGCPLMECLLIYSCPGFKTLELPSHSKLKEIGVAQNYDLELLIIKALSASKITIWWGFGSCNIDVASCKNLKHLKLSRLPITDEWLSKQIAEFSLLESLSIERCRFLEKIKISSPCLKTLSVHECSHLFEVNVDTPNLSIFRYTGVLVSFWSGHLALSEVDLLFCCYCIDTQWCLKYTELLAMFCQFSKVLILNSYSGKNAVVSKEVRQTLSPPLSSVNHLNYTMTCAVKFPFSDILDGLLWISPHVETVSLEFKNFETRYLHKCLLQFSYKKKPVYDWDSWTPLCCQSIPASCWQHCIVEVTIVQTKVFEGRTVGVETYSITGDDLLEKVSNIFPPLTDKLGDESSSDDDDYQDELV